MGWGGKAPWRVSGQSPDLASFTQARRRRAARHPVEQLDRVHDRHAVAAPSWVMQPILPAAIRSGLVARMLASLRVAQPAGDLRLQHVVGAGRAAADMRLRRLDARVKPARAQQRLRLGGDLLAVLQRAGRVIGDASGPGAARVGA